MSDALPAGGSLRFESYPGLLVNFPLRLYFRMLHEYPPSPRPKAGTIIAVHDSGCPSL